MTFCIDNLFLLETTSRVESIKIVKLFATEIRGFNCMNMRAMTSNLLLAHYVMLLLFMTKIGYIENLHKRCIA